MRKSMPQSEMQGCVIVARLITSIIEGVPIKLASMFIALDSKCTISALEAQDCILEMWFTNRVAEVKDHLESWRRKGIQVYPVHHGPGVDNVADLGTKGKAASAEIGPGSQWQEGPVTASFDMDQ